MPITTSTVNVITSAEIARANKALDDLAVAQTTITTQSTRLAAQAAELTAKTAEIARLNERIRVLETPPVVVPPVVVPPVVTPPTQGRSNIYVDGKTLRTAKGKPFVGRGIEMLYGPTAASNPTRTCQVIKDLGGNLVSPLFQPAQSNVNAFKGLLDAAKVAGLIVGFNADHFTIGVANPPLSNRQILMQPAVVSLLNQYDNVFLECEVETDWDQTGEQWKSDVMEMVVDFRNAGLRKQPIKVGSPDGGRNCEIATKFGKDVLAADPEKNILFTWQAYWGLSTTSDWTYQGENGFPKGLPGTLAAADSVAASGLCFIVGLDSEDDVGPTGYQDLAARLDFHNINWQFWCLSGDHLPTNNLVTDSTRASSATATGRTVKAIFDSKKAMVDFT